MYGEGDAGHGVDLENLVIVEIEGLGYLGRFHQGQQDAGAGIFPQTAYPALGVVPGGVPTPSALDVHDDDGPAVQATILEGLLEDGGTLEGVVCLPQGAVVPLVL